MIVCVPLAFAFSLRRQTLSLSCVRLRGRALRFVPVLVGPTRGSGTAHD